jgi:hypothetical protein
MTRSHLPWVTALHYYYPKILILNWWCSNSCCSSISFQCCMFYSGAPEVHAPLVVSTSTLYLKINVKETWRGNQEWIIQRHWLQRVKDREFYTTNKTKQNIRHWKLMDEQHEFEHHQFSINILGKRSTVGMLIVCWKTRPPKEQFCCHWKTRAFGWYQFL